MKIRHVMFVLFAAGAVAASPIVFSDDDHDDGKSRASFWSRSPDVAPVANGQYAAECGECHFAYPPGLLPERSWRKLMGSLEDHFGDNAELPVATRDTLTEYLVANSAEHAKHRRSEKIMRSLSASATPTRITETPYIQRKHDEVPARHISGNEQVRSLSNCAACHARAEQGSFSEREIDIPGAGRWED